VQSIIVLYTIIFGNIYIFRIHARIKENIGLMSSNEAPWSNQKDTPIEKQEKGGAKI
jgi:hypothetical protein